jgi:hypothetical protein
VKQRTAYILQEDELRAVSCPGLGINTREASHYESKFMSQSMSHVHEVKACRNQYRVIMSQRGENESPLWVTCVMSLVTNLPQRMSSMQPECWPVTMHMMFLTFKGSIS